MSQYLDLSSLLGDADPSPADVATAKSHNEFAAALNAGDVAAFIHCVEGGQTENKTDFCYFAERAAGLGHVDILEYCIGRAADTLRVVKKSLKCAIGNNRVATTKYLLRRFGKTLDGNQFKYQFLGMAMRGEMTITAHMHETFQYDKHTLNWALVMASCCGKNGAVKWLLKQGADAVEDARNEATWLSGKYPACL